MPRRKFRNTQRSDSPTEYTFQEFIANQNAPVTTRTELIRLIRGGEDTFLELKVKLSNPERIAQGIVALANTGGGTIVFGVTDQLRIEGVANPEWVQEELVRICREDVVPPIVPLIDVVAFDSGRRVVALDIEGRKRPYRTKEGRFYLRTGEEKREVTREEMSDWLDEMRPLGFENIPLLSVVADDFDDALLWSFANSFETDVSGKNIYQTADFLKKDLLLAIGNGDDFFPTVAAVLLFGKNERVAELLPRAKVTVQRFSGSNGSTQLIEREEFQGNLHTLNEAILQFVERWCDLHKFKPKAKKTDDDSLVQKRADYHRYSVLEAISNILMHRDLALREMPTKISIYDNSIEFINPRRTNGFAPPAARAIRYGITQRINPQIAAIFGRREYGTNVPNGGLPMILRQSHLFSGKRSEIYTSGDEFKLKIYGS